MKTILAASGLLAVAALPLVAAAQCNHTAAIQPETIEWTVPAAYGTGAQFAVVHGDPAKEGLYVVRLKVPAGFRIAAHTHPNDENVTVLSGSLNLGTGDKSDERNGDRIEAGGYAHVPKGVPHYAWFTEDTVIQLHGMGPQGITYVNPADDPRRE